MAFEKKTMDTSIPAHLPPYSEHKRPIKLTSRFDKTAGTYAEATTATQSALSCIRYTERVLDRLSTFGANPDYAEAASKLFDMAAKQKTRASAAVTRCAEMERDEIIHTYYYRLYQEDLMRQKSKTLTSREKYQMGFSSRELRRLDSGRKHWTSQLAKQEKYDSKKLEDKFKALQDTMQGYNLANKEGYQF